jgi:hypothetical protein
LAKSYTVTWGTRTIDLKYTRAERELLEQRFGIGLQQLITTKVLPVVNGQVQGGLISAQIALVHAGLKHDGPKLTEKAVGEWVDELSKTEEGVFPVVISAARAVGASGVLGRVIVDDEPDEESDEGKDRAPEPTT